MACSFLSPDKQGEEKISEMRKEIDDLQKALDESENQKKSLDREVSTLEGMCTSVTTLALGSGPHP